MNTGAGFFGHGTGFDRDDSVPNYSKGGVESVGGINAGTLDDFRRRNLKRVAKGLAQGVYKFDFSKEEIEKEKERQRLEKEKERLQKEEKDKEKEQADKDVDMDMTNVD